jgi:hypothetical protein
MSQKIQVILYDDITGDEIGEMTGGGTVKFGFRGTEYEIDLTSYNRATFEKVLEPYLVAARKEPIASTGKGSGRSVETRQLAADRREWARNNGWPDIAERGSWPSGVIEAYEKAHR